jgi:uncharacterized protein YwqG
VRPEIDKHLRAAWKPAVKDGDGAATDSKFGGLPALLAGEEWPLCPNCEGPLQLLLQLNLASIPPELKSAFGSGLIQLFYCTNAEASCETDAEGWEPFSPISLARRIDTPSAPAKLSPPEARSVPAKRILSWKRMDDLPNGEELGTAGIELTDDEFHEMEDFPVQGDKLGGWPHWVQGIEYPSCPTCATPMRLVFQIDSEDNVPWMWGDAGCAHLTQCPEHKDVLAFAWACC